jgi:DNA-binding transcriptional MerR regulator
MSEQQSQVQSQGRAATYYSEQETVQYSRLELRIIRHLADVGVISGIQVVGDEQRRYDAADLALLRRVRRLYQDLGVNLEGVEIIVRLAARIDLLRRELSRYQGMPEQRVAGQPEPTTLLDLPETEEYLP